jgi:hypothetical protein
MANVQRIPIRFREDRNGLHAELAACAIDAQRDLAPIRDQDFLKHLYGAPA